MHRSWAPTWSGVFRAASVLAGLVIIVGCSKGKGTTAVAPLASLTPPATLCTELAPAEACNRAEQIEAWLSDPALVIIGTSATPAGRQGAQLLTVSAPQGGGKFVFRAKWRPISSGTINNDPRKELAAYAVAKLFLEPHEYVLPPTTGHCFELEHYRSRVSVDAEPSFAKQGVRCVFGTLSYWLENVSDPEAAHKAGKWAKDDIFDEQLFATNLAYRKAIADLNLLTFLIRHGDSHAYQFLITTDRPTPRAYTVDNSIAFRSMKNVMLLFRKDWSAIQVPALSRRSIDRLAALSEEAWTRLLVIEQYRAVEGMLVPAERTGIVGPPDAGLRWVGLGLQIGLEEAEIRGVRARLAALVRDSEAGNLAMF